MDNSTSVPVMEVETNHALFEKAQDNDECSFLRKFPLEIRQQIYTYILVNLMLGQTELEFDSSTNGDRQLYNVIKYGLTPSILCTNRQIYEEASDILYGSNTFYTYCFGVRNRYSWQERGFVCPLQRFEERPWHDYDFYGDHPSANLASNAAALKVRHWKLVVSSDASCLDFPSQALISLCKMMHVSCPHSLEVLIIPRGVEAEPDDNYHDLNMVLRPLHLLRLPGTRFSLRDADFDEICYKFHSHLRMVPIYISQLEGDDFPIHLVDTVRGETAVEIGSVMHSSTISYARCFERFPPFKHEMGLGALEQPKGEDIQSIDIRYFQLQLTNPFTSRHFFEDPDKNAHAVEQALYLGRLSHEQEDLPGFKEQRAIFLEYLEPQYQRIIAASRNIRQFIKRHKKQGLIFDFVMGCGFCWCCDSEDYDDPFRHNPTSLAEALVYLEQYAAAFRRDAPIEVLGEIKKQQRQFARHYFDSEREALLVKMNEGLEMKDYEHFIDYFKRAFGHMEQQRLEIQKARREFFKFDLANDSRCEIDPEFGESEDLVDWSIYDEDEAED